MNNSRLDDLLKFLEEDPNDPFTLYALALEYTKTDDEKALTYFNQLLSDHPDYVATYYHAGKILVRRGEINRAIDVYKKGMEVSRKKGNNHAFAELQGAFNDLTDTDDE